MGDRDTREDAVRLATEAAKRDALEQVATYLESVTVVEGVDVTKDEIRTYTAGLVLVLDQQTHLLLDEDAVVVTVDLTAQVDTEEVEQAITALRENEDARRQLVALQQEIDGLHQELQSANQALAHASTVDQVQEASQQRQDILNRVQSNAMVSQAWTDWVLVGPVVYPYGWVGGVGGAQTLTLLNAARGLYPNSPHVQMAQQVIAARSPSMSSAPPPSISSHITAAQLNSQPIPRTLNEITHHTSTTPPQIGNQPAMTRQIPPLPASRTLTTTPAQQMPLDSRSARALRQFLQPPPAVPSQSNAPSHLPRTPTATAPGGAPPVAPQAPFGSRSVRSLQQFLQPPAVTPSSGQPPVARRLPPTINQRTPGGFSGFRGGQGGGMRSGGNGGGRGGGGGRDGGGGGRGR